MKSLFQKLGEAVEKLTDQGKFKQYREASTNCTSVEAKLCAAEKILGSPVVKESKPPVIKHNGRGDNGGEVFTESDSQQITEAHKKATAKSDAALYKGLGISESDQRRLNGLPPAGESLTANQLREYRFLRSIRLSESDSLRGARKVA